MARLLMRCTAVGVEAYDSTTGDAETGITVFGPASHDTVSRWIAERNAVNAQSPAAPCCACAARVERIEQALFFLLEGLAQWSPTIGFADQAEFMGQIIEKTRQMMRGENNAA